MDGFAKRLGSWRAWWREHVPFEHKAAITVLVLAGLLIGGWLAADSFSSGAASATGQAQAVPTSGVTTVYRVVTIHARAHPVTTDVNVVKDVYRTRTRTLPATTVIQTRTTYGTSTVTVPHDITHVVDHTVTAPAQTVVDTTTVTDLTTTVEWRVITVVEKSKPVTVTVTTP
jgi:hypothetical protein